ncbi:MAG: riboflavin biosynthesis protein RibF, partial [Prevotellaceae bacterium]|nr:riboflavin biosynthesis protein RibF [Prevotellaceae bacterium]
MTIWNDTLPVIPEPCAATIGFFDGVHVGHRFLIEQLRAQAKADELRSA